MLAESSYQALDTGSSFLALPPKYYSAFLKFLLPPEQRRRCEGPSGSAMVCPCDVRESAAVVYVVVGGQEFPILPEELFVPIGMWGGCIMQVLQTSDRMPFILGDTFLRTVAAVFDAGDKRVGLVARRAASERASLASTREALRRDADAAAAGRRRGPLMAPHQPRDVYGLSTGWYVAYMVVAVLAGAAVGVVLGTILVKCYDCLCSGRGGARPRGRTVAPAPLPPQDAAYVRMDA